VVSSLTLVLIFTTQIRTHWTHIHDNLELSKKKFHRFLIYRENYLHTGVLYYNVHGGPKNAPTCFCQNFVKSPPNLIIFGMQIAKTIQLCKVHSLSTSHNLCHHTTV